MQELFQTGVADWGFWMPNYARKKDPESLITWRQFAMDVEQELDVEKVQAKFSLRGIKIASK